MPVIIAIEGGDGSGKSTVANYLIELSEANGLTCQVVGRYMDNSTNVIGRITEILQSGKIIGEEITAEADFFMRIAREYQRASLARSSTRDLVILDRFVLSVFSRAVMNLSHYPLQIEEVLRQIVMFSGLCATIYCSCPFDKAWNRVLDRVQKDGKPLSPKESLGEDYNRQLFAILEKEFRHGTLTAEQWVIDTSVAKEDTLLESRKIFDQIVLLCGKQP